MSSTLLTVVRIIRLSIFGLVTLFSLIVLGLGAHIVSVYAQFNAAINAASVNPTGGVLASGFDPTSGFGSTGGLGPAGVAFPIDFAGLGIAVSFLTLISLITMLVLSFQNKVLWVNMVAVEVGWLGVLWVLWLATAAVTNNDLVVVAFGICGFGGSFNCGEMLGFQALSWLCWVLLFKYTIVLIALTIFQQVRGNRIWTAPVHQVDFFAPPAYSAGAPGVVYEQKTGQTGQYPQQTLQHAPQMPQQPQQPGQMGYPPALVANYQTPPPANPGYQV